MEERRGPEGERSAKRSEAREESSAARESQEEFDGSSNPKIRRMSTGKAVEKKARGWSEEWRRRNEVAAAMAADGEAERITVLRSWARFCASMA